MGYQESVWGLRNENVWGNEHAKKELEGQIVGLKNAKTYENV